MEELKKIVAKNIICLRTQNRMTQLELGEKLNYSDKAISKWERAEGIPDAYTLKQMSELFKVTVDYILSEHSSEEKIPSPLQHNNHLTITKISFVGVWTIALLVFIILFLAGHVIWLVFVYAVPVSAIVLLVFNTLWGIGKNNFYILSALDWSIIATIYLSFIHFDWWVLFMLGVPSNIIIYLCFKLRLGKKK